MTGALGLLLAGGVASVAGRVGTDVPVDPTAPEAKQWLREELAKAPYQAARPTWFDRLSQAFFDWIGSLTAPSGDGLTGWIPVVVTVVVIALLVSAVLVFGLPRFNRRSRLAGDGLFHDDDRRGADDMRRDAQAAASGGDWDLAVEEMFRAIARGLAERTVLFVVPGTTAREVAARASAAFPAERGRIDGAARNFDEVRYLGGRGSEQAYLAQAALETDLRRARPVLAEPAGRPAP